MVACQSYFKSRLQGLSDGQLAKIWIFKKHVTHFDVVLPDIEKIKSTVQKLFAPALHSIPIVGDTVTHMKTYGVTAPLSEAEPSEREWRLNRSLYDVLVQERMVESEERTKLR